MKLSVTTYSFSDYIKEKKPASYLEICDKAKEMGFDGIEFIDLYSEKWGFTDNPHDMARQIREHCASIDLDIVAYAVGANFLCDDIDAEIARVKECVDIASELGAPVMRHDIARAPRDLPNYDYRSAIEEVAPIVKEITNYAKSKGVKTCTENHGFFFQRPETIEELILAVNDENYGWLCDFGNFLCADADPLTSVAISAPYTMHAHAKDFLFKSATEIKPVGFPIKTTGGNYIRGTVIGHGIVPVASCIKALEKVGYDGFITVEFEGPEECIGGINNGLQYLKALLNN